MQLQLIYTPGEAGAPAAEHYLDRMIAARELALRRAQAGFRRVELSLGSNDSRFCVLFYKDRLFFFGILVSRKPGRRRAAAACR